MNRLVKHYQNMPSDKTLERVEMMNEMLKDNKHVFSGSIAPTKYPMITVVALRVNNLEKTEYTFGVARYSETDTDEYDKSKGIEYALWRAKNAPVFSMKFNLDPDESEVLAMFNSVANNLNRKYVDRHYNNALASLPEDVISN